MMIKSKRSMKLFALYATLLFSLLLNQGWAQASDTSPIPEWKSYPTFGIEITDTVMFDMAGSLLSTNEALGTTPRSESNYDGFDRLCSSLEVEYCDPTKKTLNSRAILNPCLGTYLNPCLDEVQVTDNSGKTHKLDYVRSVRGNTFKGDKKFNLPDGGTISLWRSEQLSGVKDFAVTYSIEYFGKKPSDNFFKPRLANVSIQPFIARSNSKARNFYYRENPPSSPNRVTNPFGSVSSIGLNDFGINCAWQEDLVCGAEQELENNYIYSVSIVTPKEFTGWLQGRLYSPQIEVQTVSNDLNKITVNAYPVQVPRVVSDIEYSKTNNEVEELFKSDKSFQNKSNFRNILSTDNLNNLKYLDAFNKFLMDKATLTSTKWSFKTMDKDDGSTSNKCLVSNTKLMGMVTTNAMIYEGGVPEFKDGNLEYRVAGLRLNPDNSVFLGAYDLVLRSEAARCLYQFTNAPLSAEISVTGSDGEKKVATTKVSEEKGWLHLGAYNFTFSQPTIKMTLKQAAVTPSPTPTPLVTSSPSPAAAILRKATVTCVKGKQTKKITGFSPKCPAGYKKK